MAKATGPEQLVKLAQSLAKNVPEQAKILSEALELLKSDAIATLRAERAEIDAALADLGYEEAPPKRGRGRRGPMSDETRAKMRAAWERRRASQGGK